MPQINPDMSYVQLPLRLKNAEDIKIPNDWLTQLGNLASAALELGDTQKKNLLKT